MIVAPGKVQSQPSTQEDIYYEEAVLNYYINLDNSIEVQMKFTLVNDSNNTGVQSVSRTVPSTTIENLRVHDASGNPLDHEIDYSNDQAIISIYFDGRVGAGSELTYFVNFSIPDSIDREGPRYRGVFGQVNLDSNNIPYHNYLVNAYGPPESELFLYEPSGVEISGENLSYSTQLDPPTSFDGLKGTWYRTPVYYKLTLTETASNNNTEKISDLSFNLMLFNKESSWQNTGLIETTGPLDTLYVGDENNWRGVFDLNDLSPGETKEFQIELVYELEVYESNITVSEVGDLSDVPSKLDNYLKPQEYWESNHSTIQQAANSITEGVNNSYLVTKKIINFVNKKLDYKVQSDRLGALQAYLSGEGDCSEYTDLSIALARAAGLPARASYGWGYGENELIGHAWPEFYLPNQGWEPADPTWTDTGGQISPGGLHPRPGPPGNPFGKFAPSLTGSAVSYLGRLDTEHIQRNIRWLDPTESFGHFTYYGSSPEFSENKDIEMISGTEAADYFFNSAELAIDRASDLMNERNISEDLNQEFELAENYLSKAKVSSNWNSTLSFSQQSIDHSEKIIGELSETPEEQEGKLINSRELYWIIIIIIIGCTIIGVTSYVTKGRD
ncbi:MAG: transglutaminase domain-containing protein [Hadesarchaea archaeon]|nr:transglutaminase domain-containing protein [Hadesarchaea archaeon]